MHVLYKPRVVGLVLGQATFRWSGAFFFLPFLFSFLFPRLPYRFSQAVGRDQKDLVLNF